MLLSLASAFIWYSYSLSFRTARREHKKPWETQEQSSFHLPPPPPHPLLADSTLALTQGGANSDRFSNRTGYTICRAHKENVGYIFSKGITQGVTQNSDSRVWNQAQALLSMGPEWPHRSHAHEAVPVLKPLHKGQNGAGRAWWK